MEKRELQEADSAYDFRQRVLQLAFDSKYSQLKDKYENWAKVISFKYCKTFYEYALQFEKELRRIYDSQREEFLSRIEYQYNLLERYRNYPTLYNYYNESLERAIKTYLEWTDHILEDFMSIVNKTISSSGISIENEEDKPSNFF